MEGMMDLAMRSLLTACTAVDLCVAEFVRVSQQVPPKRVFWRIVPELLRGAQTPAGVPVQVQLLGGDPERLAQAALVALAAGAQGIDLNFGCPAPIVNRHDGGARLLQDPERLYHIVRTVRQTVPEHIPVSAKLRLGWQESGDVVRNGLLACKGGASWLTIHGRTKAQGYRPPVDWPAIGTLVRAVNIPVVANGDIFCLDDLERCQAITGCSHFMLGRGPIFRPWLLAAAMAYLQGKTPTWASDSSWQAKGVWRHYFAMYEHLALQSGAGGEQILGRLKQWAMLIRRHTQATWPTALLPLQTLQQWHERIDQLWPEQVALAEADKLAIGAAISLDGSTLVA